MTAAAELPVFFTHVFPWPFIATGLCLIGGSIRIILRAIASHRWPTVQGKVIASRLEVTDSGGDYPVELFCPLIEYRYTADGVSRTSRNVGLAAINPGGKARAEAVLRRYKVGKGVRVHVSPADPDTAILEPGVRWPQLGKLLAGLLFLAAGSAMLFAFSAL